MLEKDIIIKNTSACEYNPDDLEEWLVPYFPGMQIKTVLEDKRLGKLNITKKAKILFYTKDVNEHTALSFAAECDTDGLQELLQYDAFSALNTFEQSNLLFATKYKIIIQPWVSLLKTIITLLNYY